MGLKAFQSHKRYAGERRLWLVSAAAGRLPSGAGASFPQASPSLCPRISQAGWASRHTGALREAFCGPLRRTQLLRRPRARAQARLSSSYVQGTGTDTCHGWGDFSLCATSCPRRWWLQAASLCSWPYFMPFSCVRGICLGRLAYKDTVRACTVPTEPWDEPARRLPFTRQFLGLTTASAGSQFAAAQFQPWTLPAADR